MVALMQQLEPRLFQMNEIIFHDMEEVNEIIFVQHGDVSIKRRHNMKDLF